MQNFTSVDLMILSETKLFLVIFWLFYFPYIWCKQCNFVIFCCTYMHRNFQCYTRTITPTFDHRYSVFYYHTRKTRWLIYICDIRSLRYESFSNWIMIFCSDGMYSIMSSKSIASKIHFNCKFCYLSLNRIMKMNETVNVINSVSNSFVKLFYYTTERTKMFLHFPYFRFFTITENYNSKHSTKISDKQKQYKQDNLKKRSVGSLVHNNAFILK